MYFLFTDIVIIFFFNDTATTEIYTLSLHDALPIFRRRHDPRKEQGGRKDPPRPRQARRGRLAAADLQPGRQGRSGRDRKSTRLNSSHANISYAVFCLKKKKKQCYVMSIIYISITYT